jgi:hypothetical protein
MDWRIGFLWMALVALGCFVDQPTALDRVCPAGNETCKCRPGNECADGLDCNPDGFCRDPRCVDGQPGCACVDGVTCDSGLECIDASCLLPGDTGGVAMTSGNASQSTTTPATVTSATTAGPGPDVTGEAEVGPGSEVGDSGVILDIGGVDSGTIPTECHCGWDSVAMYFGCGFTTATDVAGIECPDGMELLYQQHLMGDTVACDAVLPALDEVGCCLDDIVNPYCAAGNVIQFDECTDDHFACINAADPV